MRSKRIAIDWLVLVGAAVLVVTAARAGRAQVATQIGVVAGSITDERGVVSNAVAVTPTLTVLQNRHLGVTLGGAATAFETAGWSLGGSATVAARSGEVAGAAVSLNAGGGVSRSSFGATFTVADATPAIEWSHGPFTAFGGGRIASGIVSVRMESSSPPTPIPTPGRSTLISVTRTSRGPVFGGVWRVTDQLSTAPLSLSYREERGVVGGTTAVDRGAGASLTFGPVGVDASVGERTQAGVERSRFASGGVTWAFAQSVHVQVVTGRYPSDRLTGASAGRFLSAGLAYRFGGGSRNRLPTPRGVTGPADGTTRLSIRAQEADRVELYGDWNRWTPVAAKRAANGVWYVDVPLQPGEYRYAFRINQVEWRVPDGAVSAKDGFGGRSAYVTVERTATKGTLSQEDV